VDGREKFVQSNENYKNIIQKFTGNVNEPFVIIDAACHSEIMGPLEFQIE
jgi:hypothetical protein